MSTNKEMDRNAPRFGAATLQMNGGTGGIVASCQCSTFDEIYKVDRTFHVLSPEALDPNLTDPNMGWVVKEKTNVGSSNDIIARLMIQSREFINILPPHINKETITDTLYECKEILLNCEQVALEISTQVNSIIAKLERNEIPIDKQSRVYNPFPQVIELENQCSMFLSNTKRYIQLLAEIFNTLFQKKIDGPRFDEVRDKLKSEIGEKNPLYQFIAENEPHIDKVVKFRNRMEHPKKGRKFIVQNFSVLPKEIIQPPVWFIEGNPPEPIAEEMQAIVNFLLEFAEIFLIMCIFEKKDSWIPYFVTQVPADKRQIECPVRFKIGIDINKLKMPK